MGYKFKPNKSVAKRFGVSKTGKLKRHHSKTSHLMSARSPAKRRHLRGSAILGEGHARNMRKLMGVSKSPGSLMNRAKRRAALARTAAEAKTAEVKK